MRTNLLLLALAILAAIPWIIIRACGLHLGPGWDVSLTGVAIVGAAFLVSWAAEVAQFDVPRSIAMAAVALIAVLPEYAVDIYLAWRAGKDPLYIPLVSANMTGGNRLLVGVGWSLTAVLAWWSLRPKNRTSSDGIDRRVALTGYRERRIDLEDELSIELLFLAIPTVYCFSLWIKSTISLWDTGFLVLVYCGYVWMALKGPRREPEVEGPAKILADLPRKFRVSASIALFLFSAFVIVIATEPFAEGLIAIGKGMGIDEFLLIQWIAPLASEAPEMIVVAYFASRGLGTSAMTAIISSKINQWTLLVSSLPIAFSLSQGKAEHIPLDPRPREEVFLTAAQSFFALAVIADLTISIWEAVVLFLLFATQLFFPSVEVRYAYSILYLTLGMIIIVRKRRAVKKNLSFVLQYLK